MNSIRKTSRIAGLFYVLLALTAPLGLVIVPSKIQPWGDAATAIPNLLDNQMLFRAGIASGMLGQMIFLLVVWMLYQLFKDVDRKQARLMVILVVVAVPVAFVSNVADLTALAIARGKVLPSLEGNQMYEMAHLFMRFGYYGIHMVELYWGLWLLPFGWLVYKSGYFPRILGLLVFLNGVGYVAIALTFVVFPASLSIVSKIAMPFLYLGELPMMFWLLIVGAREKKATVSN